MKWWRSRRHTPERDDAAQRALRSAESALQAERARLAEATEVAERLKRWRERNHFADMIAESFRRAAP